MISLTDHTPGECQWRDLATFGKYHASFAWSQNDEDFNAFINVRQNIKRQHAPSNRAAIAEICHKRGIPLADVGAKASSNVADALGFDDHGEIAPGKRADLVRVTLVKDVPMVRGILRQGVWIN